MANNVTAEQVLATLLGEILAHASCGDLGPWNLSESPAANAALRFSEPRAVAEATGRRFAEVEKTRTARALEPAKAAAAAAELVRAIRMSIGVIDAHCIAPRETKTTRVTQRDSEGRILATVATTTRRPD